MSTPPPPTHLGPAALRSAALGALPRASVIVFDRDLQILLAEGQALTRHGFDPAAMVGRPLADVVPAAGYEQLEPVYLAALAGEAGSLEYRSSDGTRWYHVDVAPLSAEGEPVGGIVISQDITEAMEAREALDASHRWLQDILDSLAQPISVKDADARFALVNRAYEEGLGLTREQLVGKTVHDVYPPEYADAYAADDERALADGPVTEERPAPWGDGSIHVFQMTRAALRRPDGTAYGLCGVGIDVTDRKRAEEQVRNLTRQFETAFEAAPIGMALVSLDGRWLRVNRRLCEITGYSPDELAEMTFQDITHPEDLEADLAQADQLLAGEIESYTMEKRYFTKAGHLIWVLLSGSLVRDDAGEPLHFIAQVTDISERRRMIARLQELADRDPVTDLLNRRRFEDELRQQVARCRRYGEQASLLLLDIDHFKAINDRYGHALGDAALRVIGRTVKARVRATDVVARIGGDEFAVLLLNVGADQAGRLAEEIREAIHATPVTLSGRTTDITVSIGLQPLDATTKDEQAAFAGADDAMYAAKRGGRDRVSIALDNS
jgi:diguanylate cyclase (GGDEF)-like protein/PAS domain S-box-containing protein